MPQVGILNQLVVNFMNKDQKLETKTENEKSRFLVVAQITNDDFKKEFIIVPIHIKLNNEILSKNVISSYRKTDGQIGFFRLLYINRNKRKIFYKATNQDQIRAVSIIQQYQNNNDYDLNDEVFKEKMKWLWFDENYAPIIAEFNNKYMKIENKKYFLNDPFFKYDNTSERNALELLQKQLDINVNEKQLIKNITFTSNTRNHLAGSQYFENEEEVDIELEVEFQLPNKPLTYKLILESQKFKIVNCENLKNAYYEEINYRFLYLEYLFKTISETKKALDSFVKDKLPLIEELNTYLKQAATNFSESYHRDLNYGNEDLLSKIKQYAEYIINIKKQEIFYKLVENKELNDLTAAFFEKYKTIKKDFDYDTKSKKINHYQKFDHDYAIIEKFLLKELNLENFSCSEIIKQFNFKKALNLEVDLYSIKKIKFKEKVGSFINKILITLKLKKPSETVINNQKKNKWNSTSN